MKLTKNQLIILKAALDLYEGHEDTSIPDSAACAEIEDILDAELADASN